MKEILEENGGFFLDFEMFHEMKRALYGTFAELGFIKKERLKNHLKTNDFILEMKMVFNVFILNRNIS